jgi:hypothetical protein
LQQRTDELAARNSKFGDASNISPHDRRARGDVGLTGRSAAGVRPDRSPREICATPDAALYEFDGELVHRAHRAPRGSPHARRMEAYERLFPMVPTRGSITCRAILDRQTIHVGLRDRTRISVAVRNLGSKSQISVPLLRASAAIGAWQCCQREIGGFSDSQVALLQTFAEQASSPSPVPRPIGNCSSAGDLQESLEYQTATSDVLSHQPVRGRTRACARRAG